jgi:hypothetical protein
MTPLRRWFRVAVLALLLLAAFVQPATERPRAAPTPPMRWLKFCRDSGGEVDFFYCRDLSPTTCETQHRCIYY